MTEQEELHRLEKQLKTNEYLMSHLKQYAFDEHQLSKDDFFRYLVKKIEMYGLPG